MQVPAVEAAVRALARLTLVGPLFAVHQTHAAQLLMLTGQAVVALRAAAVLLALCLAAVAHGILARHHPVAAPAPLATVSRRREGESVGIFVPSEDAAHLARLVWLAQALVTAVGVIAQR